MFFSLFKRLILSVMVFFCLVGQVQAEEGIKKEDRKKVLAEVGKQIVFDAGELGVGSDKYDSFYWSFGDGGSAEGLGVLHSYVKPGYYQVDVQLSKDDSEKTEKNIDVYVYRNLFLGVIDNSVDRKKMSEIEQQVFNQGDLLWVLDGSMFGDNTGQVADLVLSSQDVLSRAKGLVIWEKGDLGLDLLVKLKQRSAGSFDDLNVAVVSGGRLSSLIKTADSAFNLVSPNSLILVGENALDFVDELVDIQILVDKLEEEKMGYQLIGIKDTYKIKPYGSWQLISRMVSFSLFKGVPLSTISLILTIPLIALLIVFSQQVVGIKAFGIYVPSLITIAFLESGIRYGALVFLVVLLTGTLARIVLRKLKILYMPRVALILTVVSFGMLVMMVGAAYFDIAALKNLSIVPLLTMVILTEKFVSAQIRFGFGRAFRLTVETFILSAVCYFLLNWQTLRVFVVSYPEWLLVIIPLLLILGRWSGLRLIEYWRFRRLIKNN